MLIESLHWSFITFGLLPLAIGSLSAGGIASIGRAAFAVRLLVILAAFVFGSFPILFFLVLGSGGTEPQLPTSDFLFAMVIVSLFVAVVVLPFLLGRWSSLRLNHVGWSRWLVLLFYVPLANVILLIVLCVAPGRELDAAVT